jgi:hypothetical protein
MKKILLLTAAIISFSVAYNLSRRGTDKELHDTDKHYSLIAGNNLSATLPNDGYTLLKQRCFICHREQPAYGKHEGLTAPPMPGVKMHYLRKYKNKEDFIRAVTEWVKNPSEDKSIMKGAVKRFGLMPAFPYPDDELRKIAEALYNLPLPEKHGMMKCGGGMHGKNKH